MPRPSRDVLRPDRITVILAAVLVPLALLTAVALVALWPSGSAQVTDVTAEEADFVTGRLLSAHEESCAGTDENRLPDGTVPGAVDCTRARIEVPRGDGTEVVEVWTPATLRSTDLPAGTQVVLARYPAADGTPETWVWQDLARSTPLTALAIGFALVVVAVAGIRGLRALIGLVIAFAVIAAFILPALLEGRDGLLVGVVGSSAIMFAVLYLAHGFSRRTTTALLGTLAGLGLTAGLGALVAHAAHLTGVTTEETYRLATYTGQLDADGLRGLFLCGVVLAGLGVLNDVTITQASAVWELRALDPTARRRDLVARGMRIGRDHIASTVYTIAFAYAGAALPVLLLLEIYQLPPLQTISSGAFAEEIARTLVGSIGLVLAIPLTTAIAAVVVTAGPVPSPDDVGSRRGRRRLALGQGGHTHAH